MKRFALLIMIASLVGCASTPREEYVNGMNLQQQMEAQIDEYLNQVLDLCVEMHGQAQSGESPVDCAFRFDPAAMHISLPSVAFHNEHAYDIARLEHHWCAAAQAKTGKPVAWVRHFRREGKIASRPCYKGEQLRRLLHSVEEREASNR